MRPTSHAEGDIGPLVEFDFKALGANVLQVARNGFESLELARAAALSAQQLFVQAFSHREHEPAWHTFGHQLPGLTRSNQLAKNGRVESLLLTYQN